ncbi:hypothetical protein SCAR479_10389 [Seiridium cardinale]|uniref:Copper acquisition factor BIM1-like domain-containing protein n=1 Tax=Seiridium cardinale TaxID=138064 RepID=A0ABR2XGE4_9PEZI
MARLGTIPANYSLGMVPVFDIDGPTSNEYQDNICLSRVPLPAGVEVKPGDNSTVQIVAAAKHGAALYSCVDITFVDSSEAPSLGSISCTNSSSISFSAVSTGNTLEWGCYTAGQMIGLGLGVGLPLLITVSALSYFLWKARKQLKAHEKVPLEAAARRLRKTRAWYGLSGMVVRPDEHTAKGPPILIKDSVIQPLKRS